MPAGERAHLRPSYASRGNSGSDYRLQSRHDDTCDVDMVTALAANQWRAALTLPNLLLADGSVLELGYEVFVLGP